MLWIYAKVYREKMKQRDLMAWVQGRYFAEAISSCFGGGYQYPQKPYGIFETASERSTPALETSHDADTNRQLIEVQVAQVQSYFQKGNK